MTRAKKQTLVKIISYILLIILTAATLMPLLWMLSASLKTNTEVFSANFRWIPAVFQWNNYVKIWSKIPVSYTHLDVYKRQGEYRRAFLASCPVCHDRGLGISGA